VGKKTEDTARDELVLVQVIRDEHPPLFVAHSLISTQLVADVAVKPAGHGPHAREPITLTQDRSEEHPPLLVAHSLTSSVH
jgi:hypothetical protein